MFRHIPFREVNWVSSSFLILTFFGALIGVPLYFIKFGIHPFLLVMFLVLFTAAGMSITLGYHRLFAHRSFQAKGPLRLFVLIFGTSAFEDSALDWASDHRNHHKHTDHEEDDPYSIQKGFFWAHMGWIFFKLYPRKLDNVQDLKKDPLVMWQHRHHQTLGLLVGFLLPTLIGLLWNGWEGALGGFLVGGLAKVVAVQHSTFFINSLCHCLGKQPYCSEGSARDSWFMALFTFGEGYHNYHHAFQHDYRNGVRWWQWDPTKWAIRICEKLGLVTDLRRVGREKIVLAQLRETQRKTRDQIDQFTIDAVKSVCPNFRIEFQKMQEFNQLLHEHYEHIEELVSKRLNVPCEILDRAQAIADAVMAQVGAVKAVNA